MELNCLPGWTGILHGNGDRARLQEGYGLSHAELDVVLIESAPEIDLRYERVYGYLQDDVTRRRPTVDLVSRTAAEKLAGRALLGSLAPLLRFGLRDLVSDPNAVIPPLLAHVLIPGELVMNLPTGQRGPDRRLASFARVGVPAADRRESLAEAPLAAGVGLNLAAKDFRLSGGSIRNAALHAAFLAAAIGMPRLLDAVRRELRTMGKVRPENADSLPARAG